jgi:hypothetical protein
MEEGEEVTQQELRQGINIMAELYGEAEVAASDLVPVLFHWRGAAPLTVRVNRNATDEMLEQRAQKEWRNNWPQLSRKALAPAARPVRAHQSIMFEEVGTERPDERRTRMVNVTLDWNRETKNTTPEPPLTMQLRSRGLGVAKVPGPTTWADISARIAAREYGAEEDVWEASMPAQIEDGCVIRVRRREVRVEIREGSSAHILRIQRDAIPSAIRKAIEVATKWEPVRIWVGSRETSLEDLKLEEKLIMRIETRAHPERTGERPVQIEAKNGRVQYTFQVLGTATDEQIKEEISKWLGRGVDVRVPRPLKERNAVEWREKDGNTVEIELRNGGKTKYKRVQKGISRGNPAEAIRRWSKNEEPIEITQAAPQIDEGAMVHWRKAPKAKLTTDEAERMTKAGMTPARRQVGRSTEFTAWGRNLAVPIMIGPHNENNEAVIESEIAKTTGYPVKIHRRPQEWNKGLIPFQRREQWEMSRISPQIVQVTARFQGRKTEIGTTEE